MSQIPSLGTIDPAFVHTCKKNQHLRSLFYDVIPPLTDTKELNSFLSFNKRLNNEDVFEELMEKCTKEPIYMAVEKILPHYFGASRVIFWDFDQFKHTFRSKNLNITLPNDETLISAAARAKVPLNVASIDNRQVRKQLDVQKNAPQLVFPLYLRSGEVIGVVHLSRNEGDDTFSNENIDDATFFMKKYTLYGTAVSESTLPLEAAYNVSLITEPKELYDHLCTVFSRSFDAKDVEIWCYREKTNTFYLYNPDENEFIVVKKNMVGAVGYSLMTNVSLNERNVRNHSNYYEKTDGKTNQPIMTATGKIGEYTYSVALRGRTEDGPFTSVHKQMMDTITPFLLLSIAYSFKILEAPVRNDDGQYQRLTDLIKFGAKITSYTNLSSLIQGMQTILTKKFERKVRFSLIWKNHLYSDFTGGFETGKNFVNGNGITGYSIFSQTPVILPITDEHFNSELDIGISTDDSGQLTEPTDAKSLIVVPIFSATNDVLGALTLINTSDDLESEMYEDDMSKLSAYAVFCGIALQNALTIKQVSISLDILCQYKRSDKMTPENIVQMAMDSFNGYTEVVSATLYVLTKDFELVEIGRSGVPLENGNEYARAVFNEKETKVFRISDQQLQSLELGFTSAEIPEETNEGTGDDDETVQKIHNSEFNSERIHNTEYNSEGNTEQNNENEEEEDNGESSPIISHKTESDIKESQSPVAETETESDIKESQSPVAETETENEIKESQSPVAEQNAENKVKIIDADEENGEETVHDGDGSRSSIHSPPACARNRCESITSSFSSAFFCCVPIYGSDKNTVIGVFQYCARGPESITNAIIAAAETIAFISKDACLQFTDDENLDSLKESIESGSIHVINFVTPDFDPSKHDKQNLILSVMSYFNREKLIDDFHIPYPKLYNFLQEIEKHSKQTHHDFNHALSVFSQVLRMTEPNFSKVLKREEYIALLIAALSHDIDHDGFAAIKVPVLYELLLNDYCVQEMKSLSTLMRILESKASNILSFTKDRDTIIENIINLVKATNMKYHFPIVENLETMAESKDFSFEEPTTRLLACQLILKAADLGSVNRASDLVKTDGLADEFFSQGDLSKLDGIVLDSKTNTEEEEKDKNEEEEDHNADKKEKGENQNEEEEIKNENNTPKEDEEIDRNTIHWSKSMPAFLNCVVLRTYEVLSHVLPELEPMYENVKHNIETLLSQ